MKAMQKDQDFDQKSWNDRLIKTLRANHKGDTMIESLIRNDKLCRTLGGLLRFYVDKKFTDGMYHARKSRGAEHQQKLVTARIGLETAVQLLAEAREYGRAVSLIPLIEHFSAQMGRLKEAYSTKRLGRDRAHFILYACQVVGEAGLKRSISFVTLADLVNASFEADGQQDYVPATEEHIRKNFSTLDKNSPRIRALVDYYLVVLAET